MYTYEIEYPGVLILHNGKTFTRITTMNRETAQTIVNALNLAEELKETYTKHESYHDIDRASILFTAYEDIIGRSSQPEETREAGPPQPRIPERIACRYCKGIATRMLKTPYLHTCSCGGRYDNEMNQWTKV